jgi:hypothetical protein
MMEIHLFKKLLLSNNLKVIYFKKSTAFAVLFLFLSQMKRLTLILFISALTASAQNQTVGVFENTGEALNGYTLFSPNTNTYLIDNCGKLINSWPSLYKAGSSVYLLGDGSLLRACRIQHPVFSAGGSGGRIEKTDWYGNLLWAYNFSDSSYHQHHDFTAMSNGNLLVLCWEYKDFSESILAGRDSSSMIDNELWPTYIVEIEPIGYDSINIVWEWHLWDHLVQDYDSTKQNYGIVSENPHKLNVNFYSGNGKNDWVHANSIDYNETLDQIVISSRTLSEFYVIDHSTSTSEAATSIGGIRGKGGDFLYRWGNPIAYDSTLTNHQQLIGQHNVHWIKDGLLDEGKFMLFNNGQSRGYSSVEIISAPVDQNGDYFLGSNNVFGPDSSEWIYTEDPLSDFYSSYISGAQRLENGNTLICDGAHGTFFEINQNKEKVWKYVNPVLNTYTLSQEDTIPITQNGWGNATFRSTKYPMNFPGFDNKDMTPFSSLELNPYLDSCSMISSINNLISSEKYVVNILDLVGRNTSVSENKILFYIYSDGTVEKKIIIQ